MSTLPSFLRSILITGIFSFITPSLFIIGVLVCLSVLGYVPWFSPISQVGLEQITHFLSVFGSGSSLNGLLVIGLVCSLVGILFDTYTFYRHQNLRNN
jgi:type III secretory pathway component EscU